MSWLQYPYLKDFTYNRKKKEKKIYTDKFDIFNI